MHLTSRFVIGSMNTSIKSLEKRMDVVQNNVKEVHADLQQKFDMH